MEKVFNLYKKSGETPLECLERFRKSRPELADEKMTYAGRLDPLAEGVLLVLVGEETKNREAYTSLPKEYIFEWTFGIETDTYDLLGIVGKPQKNKSDFLRNASALTRQSTDAAGSVLENQIYFSAAIENYFEKQKGKIVQKYPPFSSKVVDGKSLFSLAKGGRIKEKDLPTHEVEVKEIKYGGARQAHAADFLSHIEKEISAVHGDFRQKEILKRWKKFFAENEKEIFTIHKAKIETSSGFYVRQFVHDVGVHFGVPSVTVSILRTKVGEFEEKDSIR